MFQKKQSDDLAGSLSNARKFKYSTARDLGCKVSHLTHMRMCAITHLYVWRDSFVRDVTHSYVKRLVHMWLDAFIFDVTQSYVPWRIHTLRIHIKSDIFICDVKYFYETRRIHMQRDSSICDVTHSYVTWLIHMWGDAFICDATHSLVTVTFSVYTWCDSTIYDVTHTYVTWLIHMWRDSFMCDVTYPHVTWLIHMWRDSSIRDVTHLYVTWLIHSWRDSSRYLNAVDFGSMSRDVIFKSVMAHTNVTSNIHTRHDSSICDVTYPHVTWLTQVHDCSGFRVQRHVVLYIHQTKHTQM